MKRRTSARKARQSWVAISTIAALIAFSASGFAQDEPAAAAPAPAAGEPAAGEPAAELTFGKTGQLTPAEQQTQSRTYMHKMKSIDQRVKRLGDKARADRDLIKLNCVNDKGLQIRGNLNVAEQTDNKLKTAIAARDDGGRGHEFSKLTIIFQKVTVLGQEAEACVGEEIAYVGQTRVTVDIDPNVAAAPDPTEEAVPLAPVGRPPLASPFL